MLFRNKIKLFAEKMLKEFWPLFFLCSSFSLALLAFISAEVAFLEDDALPVYAFTLLLLSFITWYLYVVSATLQKQLLLVIKVFLPLTLVTILAYGIYKFRTVEDFDVYITLFFVAQSVLYFLSFRKSHPVEQKKVQGKLFYGCITVILLMGIFLCGRQAYTTPTISPDEAHSSNAAYGILSKGLPYFPNSEVVYSRSWVDLYSIALSYKLFGFSEFSARLPSVIAYGLSIILFFLILKKTSSRLMTIIALGFFAFNPWILYYGSYARMYIFLLLFSTLFCYLLIRYIDTREKKILYLFIPLALMGGMFSERSFLLFVPPYFLLVLWSLPRTFVFWKKIFLYFLLPALVIIGTIAIAFFTQVSAFVLRYVVGFDNGSLFARLRIEYTPVYWLSYFSVPSIFLIASTIAIVILGSKRERIILALFWFGGFLVDLLIYSNFPERRFNYSFILVSLYALVIVFGFQIMFRIIPAWLRNGIVGFVIIFMSYHYATSYYFPDYADFSKIRDIPKKSLVIGYPTSPAAFYNIKYGLEHDIRPFITDTIEMNKYTENGKEIYSGGVPVRGVTPLNVLRETQDVYLFYEKSRLSFVNERTETYIFENCQPINEEAAFEVNRHIQEDYLILETEIRERNALIAMKCPQIVTPLVK